MGTLTLDMGVGLGNAVKLLLTISLALIPISVWLYLMLAKTTLGYLKRALYTIVVTVCVSVIVLYTISQIKGAEPFTSLVDPELLLIALGQASFSVMLIIILAVVGYVNNKKESSCC